MVKKKAEKHELPNVNDRPKSASVSPLIFISHDTRDADLAEAFAKLIASVSCGMLKTFRSSDKQGIKGIEYGLEWYPQIMEKLDASAGVVCLLTEKSLNRPWILYEAGVAKGKLNVPVSGIALGISLQQANTGPFAQFQNCEDDLASLSGLVMQLLGQIEGSEPDKEVIKIQVQAFIEKKTKLLSKAGAGARDKEENKDVPIAKLFEEVKLIVQDLPTKLEGRLNEAAVPRRRRGVQFHPRMAEEIFFRMRSEDSSVGLLVVFGLLRDDCPWLYDIGKEFYEAIRDGHGEKARRILNETMKILDFTQHHPMVTDIGILSKDMYSLFHHLPHMMEDCLHECIKRNASKRASKLR